MRVAAAVLVEADAAVVAAAAVVVGVGDEVFKGINETMAPRPSPIQWEGEYRSRCSGVRGTSLALDAFK